MQIVNARPPNYDAIVRAIPSAARMRGVIFCYGNTIFNPGAIKVSDALVAHETQHSARQGAEPEAWWARYLAEPPFRFEEELPAHQAEYAFLRDRLGRGERRKALHDIASRLAGPLYGAMVSLAKARDLIEAA